jgi:hypothetical protein
VIRVKREILEIKVPKENKVYRVWMDLRDLKEYKGKKEIKAILGNLVCRAIREKLVLREIREYPAKKATKVM